MRYLTHICGVMALAAGLAAAEDFPLDYRTFTADEVAGFPRSSGLQAVLRRTKPLELFSEPPATSSCPLYGQFLAEATNGASFCFRLDESRGTGQGYDRLIIDLNRNGDLADDPIVPPAAAPRTPLPLPENREEMFFGPIAMPAARPLVYFAQCHLYNRQLLSQPAGQEPYFGQLRLKAGWCLEAAVSLKGIRQKVGVVDNNGNLLLSQPWHLRPSAASHQADWDIGAGDCFLQRPANSSRVGNQLFTTECSLYPFTPECSPFGSILYFGAKPWRIALSADAKQLHVEPWSGSLAELVVQPHGKQVRSLSLAWENPPGQWQLIKPNVRKGRALIPPGNYRLYGCLVEGKAGLFHQLRASAFDRSLQNSFRAESGKVSAIFCGAPLEIKVAANWQLPEPSEPANSRPALKPFPSGRVLRINAKAVGAGGETYSAWGVGQDYDRDPQHRVFIIRSQDGKEVASGNLEFG